MQTQQDHVHAYQALVGRMSYALLRGDTSNGEQPAHRTKLGLILGLVLALLAGVAFWLYGVIKPGGNTVWRKPGVILVEKETGNRYVYRNGALMPVINQASAMLLQGAGAKVELISKASLADLPRADPIGIPGAPETVPERRKLTGGPWLLCLPQATGDTGGPDTGAVSLTMWSDIPAETMPDNHYTLVAGEQGARYLVYRHRKLPVTDDAVPIALGLGMAAPPRAGRAWLSALPTGEPVGAVDIPSAGAKGARVAGRRHKIGDLFTQKAGGTTQHYTMLDDGLAPIGRTDFALLQAKSGLAATDLDAAAVAVAPKSKSGLPGGRAPDLLSAAAVTAGESTFCLRQHVLGEYLSSEVVTVPRNHAGWPMSGRVGAAMKPTTGALAVSIPVPTGPGAKLDRYLITDRGFKYQLRTDDAVAALGFGGVTPVPMPAELLAAIPSGPALSRAAVGVAEKG